MSLYEVNAKVSSPRFSEDFSQPEHRVSKKIAAERPATAIPNPIRLFRKIVILSSFYIYYPQ
jgi:hypothetical protein